MECAATYREIFLDNKKTMIVQPFPHVIDTLRELHRRGYILGVASSRNHCSLDGYVKQMQLETSPAVSSRIHKLETDGIISGYTVTLNRPADRMYVDALISLSVAPSKQDAFLELLQSSKEVLQCYHVTGAYTFLVKVSCGSMPQLEHLILQFQKLGTTSTQIILSTPVNHGELDALML